MLSSGSICSGCIYIDIPSRYLYQKTKVWNFCVKSRFLHNFPRTVKQQCVGPPVTHVAISLRQAHLGPWAWSPSLKPELLETWSNSFSLTTVRFQQDKSTIALLCRSFWWYNPIEFPPLVTSCLLQFTGWTAISEFVVTNLAFYYMPVNPCTQCRIIIFLIDFSIILLTTLSESFVSTAFILIISIRWSVVIFLVLDGER